MKVTKKQIEELKPCKGYDAVKIAIKFLVKLGYFVILPQKENANGHDLVAIRYGKVITFEVKPIRFISRSFRVEKVLTKSDGIILVLPNGVCIIEDMKVHLKLCSPSGIRFMTFVGNIYTN